MITTDVVPLQENGFEIRQRAEGRTLNTMHLTWYEAAELMRTLQGHFDRNIQAIEAQIAAKKGSK